MEIYSFKSVNFTYPSQKKKTLVDISFNINQGEFVILCGPSGCGKTTLLRHFKTILTPQGDFDGEILFKSTKLCMADAHTQAKEIGFVLQSPENQIVTDKVWHELAFGLENLGVDSLAIRRRVAETASFFGIENWFYKNVNELSGGQKQILNLASVMAMQPSVLILDEPTSQLDPIFANEFLSLLAKINREFNTTIILADHRIEEAFPYASRVIVMENGKIICDGEPKSVGLELKAHDSKIFLSMPTAMRVWAGLNTKLDCPVTIREGSEFLEKRANEKDFLPLPQKNATLNFSETVLQCKDVWFRYEKNSPDILKGLSLTLKKGEFYAILGGNGTGKTTALKVLSSLKKAYRGKFEASGKTGLLPQNPQTLFIKNTVIEDLYEVLEHKDISKEEKDKKVIRIASLCKLTSLLHRHPYDISGGEQQRLGLAKLLLTSPDILLLDEPTKGFDAEFKMTFAAILKKLTEHGVTILAVSHDVAFCAEYANRCGLFFDGNIVTEDSPREFFSGNSFYTTSANKMARHILPKAVTVNDILLCAGGVPKNEIKIDDDIINTPPPMQKGKNIKSKSLPLPLWRKILAFFSALVALGVLISASPLIDASVFKSDNIIIWQYGILIVSMLVFIFATSRKKSQPIVRKATDRQPLSKRTVFATIAVVILIPLTLLAGIFLFDNRYFGIIAILVLIECMLPFLLIFEGRKPKAREIVIIAVLCALGVAGRSVFFMFAQFKPVTALTIIAGVAFGAQTGFLVGATTILASNMLFSQGPWTPWQMFAMGLIGFIAGLLFNKGFLSRSKVGLSIFGALSAIIIYGGIMNPASALMWSPETINAQVIIAYYVSGFPMDLIHAFATVIFLLLGAEPMLEKLDRIKEKYGLVK